MRGQLWDVHRTCHVCLRCRSQWARYSKSLDAFLNEKYMHQVVKAKELHAPKPQNSNPYYGETAEPK